MTAPRLAVDPWQVCAPDVDPGGERLAVSETLFALANGYVGMRGTLDAFWLHRNATDGLVSDHRLFEILVETARLWTSMGHRDVDGGWHLFGMTGPDEHTGVVDDNVFINLMARRNLRWAADAAKGAPDLAAQMGVDADEIAEWRDVAHAAHIPWDEDRRVHPMNAGFTTDREWRFADHLDCYPLQDHHHDAKIYRRQVLKQADLVQALWWCRDEFSDEEVARDLGCYEARTVRDSSLSASVQAVVCAQAGHPDLALRYLREAALMDLRNVQGDTDQGLHLAAVRRCMARTHRGVRRPAGGW